MAPGDVVAGPMHAKHPAVGRSLHEAACVEHSHGAIGTNQAMLELEGPAVAERLRDDVVDTRSAIGVNALDECQV